eukprot:GEMP01069844.1.p1 GENE.GEMP01069844.1~~GEMP01069844.1.p1  ORF type:complete len:196 (+),score=34.08 GEMP01069844.1:157-744(+)
MDLDAAGESTELEFTSWWTEVEGDGYGGGKMSKRFVYITFSILDGTFSVCIDNDTNTYFIPVIYNHKTGEPTKVWDLYVGAEIDILGRITTLHQCSLLTKQWNHYWKRKLVPIWEALLAEMSKYHTRKVEPWILTPPKDSCNLRLLMSQVAELQDRMAEYRPRKAAMMRVPPEMYEMESIRSTTTINKPDALKKL